MNRLLLAATLLFASLTGTLAQDKGSVDYQDLYSPKVTTITAGATAGWKGSMAS